MYVVECLKKALNFIGDHSFMIYDRAGSVLTETEEPAVFDDFLRTETEIKPISKKIGNQTRTGTELENRG